MCDHDDDTPADVILICFMFHCALLIPLSLAVPLELMYMGIRVDLQMFSKQHDGFGYYYEIHILVLHLRQYT